MNLTVVLRYTLIFFLTTAVSHIGAQDHHGDDAHATSSHGADNHGEEHATNACGGSSHHGGEFDAGATAFHHISDQNIYNIGWFHFPLPCIFYVPGEGLEMFSSGKFDADAHGNGSKAYNRYVLFGGQAKRITDPNFPKGLIGIGDDALWEESATVDGKKVDKVYLCYEGNRILCDPKSTLDFGLFGGGLTSFHDFSITKNVVSMFLIVGLLSLMFIAIAKAYKNRQGMAPSGIQGFIEPIFEFIQEDVSKPFLGDSWERFQPFLMSLFFFILGLNLFGQIPFLGGSNVTGNLSVTLVLAVLAFIMTTINGKKDYWGHVFNMPGVPWPIKYLVVTPVEIMGLFIKPLTLMLRLFGNMVAGHMVIVIFVGLIFIFGKNGANPAAAWGTSIGSVFLTLFMMAIELLVAFIQAFVFTILTASYIGAAIEVHDDH